MKIILKFFLLFTISLTCSCSDGNDNKNNGGGGNGGGGRPPSAPVEKSLNDLTKNNITSSPESRSA